MAHLQRRNGSTRFQVHSASSYPHRDYYLPSYPTSWPAYPTPSHPPSEPCYPISIPSPPLQISSRYKDDLPRSPSLTPDFAPNDITDDLCALTDQSDSPCTTPSPPCSVKVEPEEPDGCFIMEFPSFGGSCAMHKYAPPTEVPLRATYASSAMFKMMSVFHLNPFAMHSGKGRGVVSPTWHGGEARPLDEEPITFEFQVDLEDLNAITTSPLPNTTEQVRSFSPEFQLHRDELKNQDRTDWVEYPLEDISAPSVDWEKLECPAEDHLQPANLTGSYLRHHTRLHNSVSHPYLRKSQLHDQNQTSHTPYTNFPVSASNSCIDLHRMPPSILDGRTRSGIWSGCFGGAERAGYAPRRNNFADPSSSDSPVSEAIDLHPSAIAMNVSRRLSLPESRAPSNGPFLM